MVKVTKKAFYDTKRVFETISGQKIFLKDSKERTVRIFKDAISVTCPMNSWEDYAFFEHQLSHAMFGTDTEYLKSVSKYWAEIVAKTYGAEYSMALSTIQGIANSLDCLRVHSFWLYIYPASGRTFLSALMSVSLSIFNAIMVAPYDENWFDEFMKRTYGERATDQIVLKIIRVTKGVLMNPKEIISIAIRELLPVISLLYIQPSSQSGNNSGDSIGSYFTGSDNTNPQQSPSQSGFNKPSQDLGNTVTSDHPETDISTGMDRQAVLRMVRSLSDYVSSHRVETPHTSTTFNAQEPNVDDLKAKGLAMVAEFRQKLGEYRNIDPKEKLMFTVNPLMFGSPVYSYDPVLYSELEKVFRRYKSGVDLRLSYSGVMVNIEGYIQRISGYGTSEMFYEPVSANNLNISLLIDLSRSMTDEFDGVRKIDYAARLGLTMYKVLKNIKGVNFSVYGFSGTNQDHQLMIDLLTYEKLSKVLPFGSTPTYNAIEYVTEKMSKAGGRKLLIIITDGEPTHSVDYLAYAYTRKAIERARQSGILVYTVLIFPKSGLVWVPKTFGPSGAYSVLDPKRMYRLVADMITSTVLRHLESG